MEKIKWAVNATGNIARQFAEGIRYVADAEISAVSSTSLEHARSYASEFGIDESSCYEDFEEMLSCGDYNIVYICTPNHLHYEHSMQCFKHNAHVLCEKPLADNLWQTEDLINTARSANLFFLEGMWTRFFPAVRKVRDWLSEGKIGRPKTLYAGFGANQRNLESQWRYVSKSAGGALRDVGIYPIAFSYLVFGQPVSWAANCELNEAGIDIDNNIMLQYKDGAAAFISSSLISITPFDLKIIGTEGQIIVHPYFWKPQKAELFIFDGSVLGQRSTEVFEEQYSGSGFEYEIKAVGDCLKKNKNESEDYTLQETLDITKLMEDMRKEWGVIYDSDR